MKVFFSYTKLLIVIFLFSSRAYPNQISASFPKFKVSYSFPYKSEFNESIEFEIFSNRNSSDPTTQKAQFKINKTTYKVPNQFIKDNIFIYNNANFLIRGPKHNTIHLLLNVLDMSENRKKAIIHNTLVIEFKESKPIFIAIVNKLENEINKETALLFHKY